MAKRYYCFETKQTYESGKKAAEAVGMKPSHVYKCAESMVAGYWLGCYPYHFIKEEDAGKFLNLFNFTKKED